MSRNRSKNGAEPYRWVGHIQVYMNDKERHECINWITDRQWDFADAVDGLVQAEVGVKFKFSAHFDGYGIILQPQAKSSPYRGYTVGFHHTDLERLLHIAVYIHDVLMEHGALPLPDKGGAADW